MVIKLSLNEPACEGLSLYVTDIGYMHMRSPIDHLSVKSHLISAQSIRLLSRLNMHRGVRRRKPYFFSEKKPDKSRSFLLHFNL